MDPVAFRREYLKDSRLLAVLDMAAKEGGWGASLPAGMAPGIGVHSESPAAIVVDPGFAINPRGLEAQMLGGLQDAIALALTSSLHIQHGIPLEGSWDNYFYTRQWNTPLDVEVVVMPNTGDSPSGAGELGVAPCFAAVACAYARATGSMPTAFPINHGTLGFTPLPLEPSTPQSPTDGLDHTF